ncbi:unnamed protein product [Ceratitis capitata]|uniref:(Mediterranean fruit fly) hypothetical protein n=1 Tax=Ceratitis capitata TaxID=7213 RepID=A0A811UXD9_CERCA|nr:unnamed protein product [Ceratitis capitata]
MAKTRIKTTPTRMQKDALMASAATATAAISKPVVATTCHTVAPLDDVKKRLRHSTAPPKLSQNISGGTSTIIVTAPKRTNSISSITSTISQISDMNSDTESPPPPIVLTTSTTPTLTAASTTATKSTRSLLNTTHVTAQAPRTLNSLLCKPSINNTTTASTNQHPAALRNRKVFMITEKTDEFAGVEASTSTAASGLTTGQKRKMYLIMEENSCGAEDGGEEYGEGEDTISRDAQKYLKRENGLIAGAGGTKKLTLFADKADSGTLTEKFEKILPEILNRIQAKETNGVGGGGGGGGVGGAVLAYDAPLHATTTTVTSKLLNGSVNLNIIKSEPLSQQQQQQQHKQQQQQTQLQLKQEPFSNRKTTDEKPANERLPITLPPKKNRTKIITTNYNGNSFANNFSDNFNKTTNNVWGNFGNSSNNNANNNNSTQQKIAAPPGQVKQISAATPVIVSAVTLNARQHHQNDNSSNKNNNNSTNHTHNGNNNNNSNSSSSTCEIKRLTGKATNNNNVNSNNTINTTTTTATTPPNNTNIRYVSHANGGSNQVGGVVTTMAQVELVPQKNINLSTDFHFLIKMLPKLESIPEPHKNNVKNCIEKIITQNANIFAKQ